MYRKQLRIVKDGAIHMAERDRIGGAGENSPDADGMGPDAPRDALGGEPRPYGELTSTRT